LGFTGDLKVDCCLITGELPSELISLIYRQAIPVGHAPGDKIIFDAWQVRKVIGSATLQLKVSVVINICIAGGVVCR
jgi:hypothetical protein